MKGKKYHSRLQPVEYTRIFQVGIAGMYVAKPIAEFYFGRNRYKRQVKIETQPHFGTQAR
jgi:hypothetical protein